MKNLLSNLFLILVIVTLSTSTVFAGTIQNTDTEITQIDIKELLNAKELGEIEKLDLTSLSDLTMTEIEESNSETKPNLFASAWPVRALGFTDLLLYNGHLVVEVTVAGYSTNEHFYSNGWDSPMIGYSYNNTYPVSQFYYYYDLGTYVPGRYYDIEFTCIDAVSPYNFHQIYNSITT